MKKLGTILVSVSVLLTLLVPMFVMPASAAISVEKPYYEVAENFSSYEIGANGPAQHYNSGATTTIISDGQNGKALRQTTSGSWKAVSFSLSKQVFGKDIEGVAVRFSATPATLNVLMPRLHVVGEGNSAGTGFAISPNVQQSAATWLAEDTVAYTVAANATKGQYTTKTFTTGNAAQWDYGFWGAWATGTYSGDASDATQKADPAYYGPVFDGWIIMPIKYFTKLDTSTAIDGFTLYINVANGASYEATIYEVGYVKNMEKFLANVDGGLGHPSESKVVDTTPAPALRNGYISVFDFDNWAVGNLSGYGNAGSNPEDAAIVDVSGEGYGYNTAARWTLKNDWGGNYIGGITSPKSILGANFDYSTFDGVAIRLKMTASDRLAVPIITVNEDNQFKTPASNITTTTVGEVISMYQVKADGTFVDNTQTVTDAWTSARPFTNTFDGWVILPKDEFVTPLTGDTLTTLELGFRDVNGDTCTVYEIGMVYDIENFLDYVNGTLPAEPVAPIANQGTNGDGATVQAGILSTPDDNGKQGLRFWHSVTTTNNGIVDEFITVDGKVYTVKSIGVLASLKKNLRDESLLNREIAAGNANFQDKKIASYKTKSVVDDITYTYSFTSYITGIGQGNKATEICVRPYVLCDDGNGGEIAFYGAVRTSSVQAVYDAGSGWDQTVTDWMTA